MIDRFFGLHQELIRSGLCAKMRPGELKLYVYLMHESERWRTRELIRTDAEIRQSGLAPRTACNARKKLQEHGFITYRATTGNRYIYTICDPRSGQPYPGGARERVPYVKGANVLSEPEVESHGMPGIFSE
jgi:hypothetical protein